MSDETTQEEGQSSERGSEGWEQAISGPPLPEVDPDEKSPEEPFEGQEGASSEDADAEADLAEAWAELQAEEDAADDEPADGPNAEAARRRRQLREVEAQRDHLLEQVEVLQRQNIEHIVGDRLHDVNDLFAKHDVGDLLGENGAPDGALIDAAINELPPHFRKEPPPLYVQGFQGKGEPREDATWGDVLGRR